MKISYVAQILFYTFNFVNSKQKKSFFWFLITKSMRLVKNSYLRFNGDRLVKYILDDTQILIPLSHNLPIIRESHPEYSKNIGRISAGLYAKYPEMTLIDIGANIGDTVAILRKFECFPILCVDGDISFYSILKENTKNLKDVDCVNSFIGDESKFITGNINVSGGTGHISENLDSDQIFEIKKLSSVLKLNPIFESPRIIKIDTDGYDCLILKSELELLGRLKSVLFFEYDPYFFSLNNDDGFKVFDELKNIGYRKVLIFENTGEYLINIDLDNHMLLEDIHNFYSGWKSEKYCDICIFHEQDLDVFYSARINEIKHFKEVRN